MLLNYAKEKRGNKIADATLWNFCENENFLFLNQGNSAILRNNCVLLIEDY